LHTVGCATHGYCIEMSGAMEEELTSMVS